MFDRFGQMARDQPNRLQRVNIGHRRAADGHEGFDGVNQRIHAGVRREQRIHRGQNNRVYQRNVRNNRFADNRDFHSRLRVVNNRKLRHIRGRAAGCRDANQRRHRRADLIHAFKRQNMLMI